MGAGGLIRWPARLGMADVELGQLPGGFQGRHDFAGKNPPIGADAGVQEV